MSRHSQTTEIPTTVVAEETVLKISKEVVIKFIEMGRVTPSTFDDTFKKVHATIRETLQRRADDA